MRACWRCHGDGIFEVNDTPNRDPQCGYDVRCPVCRSTGMIEDGVTREELDHMEPGNLYDVTLIDRDHELGHRVKHPGMTFRMRFEHVKPEMALLESRRADRSMRNPVAHMIWGEAVVDDVPEGVSSADDVTDPQLRADLHYGFHTWLVRSIDEV